MGGVRPKKSLGQHFLTDKRVAERIVSSLKAEDCSRVIEIGAGMGILTELLLKRDLPDLMVIDIDTESVEFLRSKFPDIEGIVEADILNYDFTAGTGGNCAIIGNFPYNISSQILFRVLEKRDRVNELTGMFQKEVAERICSGPGNKVYGILSVLTQAFYTAEYLFTVSEGVFNPPPKVKSGVIRLIRREELSLGCDEVLFFRVVKAGFNQRRKTLRNALRQLSGSLDADILFAGKRAEQLSVDDFVLLTNQLEKKGD